MLKHTQVPMRGVRESGAGRPTVGLNAHLLSLDASYRNAGLSRYIYQLMQRMPSAAPDMDLVGYVGEPGVSLPGWQMRPSAWRTSTAPRRILWEQLAQPWALRRDRIDLLHALVNVGPAIHSCPLIVTIHDLTFVRYPALFPGERRGYLQRMTRFTAKHAARVIVDSASTGRDVEELLGVPSERITVIYPGVNTDMERPLGSAAACALRARYGLPEEFVLFVGTLEPRKNIALLLDAWSLLADRHGLHPTLVIVGGKGWFYESLETSVQAMGLSSRVRFAGYVLDADLPVWYSAATLFVYPSLYEGFGLPPLEAMACGTPVLVSDRSSLPEVVGEAGLSLPPDDAQAWADAIALLLGSPDRRQAMTEAGLEQAARFSWSQTARQTAEVYRQVLDND
jgi:glycosyltransferase involved in cell wall biosynthesis